MSHHAGAAERAGHVRAGSLRRGWNGRDHTASPWLTDRSSGGSSAGAAAGADAAFAFAGLAQVCSRTR
jgi:hypothetical protein